MGKLALDVALLISAFGAVAVLGAMLLLRPIRTRLKALETSMVDLVGRDEADIPPTPDPLDTSFEGCFAGFEWRTHDVVTHLNAALAEVEKLDRLA